MKTRDLKSRWHRLRNFQSRDFWAMVFARPLTILFLLPICEIRWVTPNLITVAALLLKAAGVALLFFGGSYTADVFAAVLLNLGLVADNMDGTLARYHRSSTYFGSYLDKVSDAVMWIFIFWAMAYRAYQVSGAMEDLVLPLMGVSGVLMAGYAKWAAKSESVNVKVKALSSDREALLEWARKTTGVNAGTPPPRRNAGDWARFFGWAFFSIILFNEVDLFFWIGLALITGHHWIFTQIICAALVVGAVAVPVGYAVKMYRLERRCP